MTWERVTQYMVSAIPEGTCVDEYAWQVEVSWRGPDDLWAVLHHGSCLGSNGRWDYEPSPSNREDDWKATHRFPLVEALRLAHEVAPKICINGFRPADLIAKYRDKSPEGIDEPPDYVKKVMHTVIIPKSDT